MQAQRWNAVYNAVGVVASQLPRGGRRFPDRAIVLVWLWAAFSHKPVVWACARGNWPLWMQRLLPKVPSPTTMCRRMRRESIAVFMEALFEHAQGPVLRTLTLAVDSTALEIRRHSKDPHARYGWASGHKGTGYRVHVLLDGGGRVMCWRVAPMNTSEEKMAARMLRRTQVCGYVLGDANYDSNPLHRVVAALGGQLVAPRPKPGTEPGHRVHAPGRLRCIEMLEGPSCFGRALYQTRQVIERFFAHADASAHGLGELPAWVRTMPRVTRWVHAKLIINALRIARSQAA